MNRIRKMKKNVLQPFAEFNDEQLLNEFRRIIKEVVIITLSEKETEKILLKYNKKICFSSFNRNIKSRYFALKECIGIRGLSVPQEWYDVSITEEDVIRRLREIQVKEMEWIAVHRSIFDSYYFDGNSKELEEIISSENKIFQIQCFYETIIEDEFNHSKQLKK